MEKKVKWIVFFTLAIVFFTTLLLANDEAAQSSEEKIDSIYVWQKEMYRTHKDEPLIGKRYGVELNFIRFLLFGSDTDGINHTLSGGVSLFYHEKNVELSFPFRNRLQIDLNLWYCFFCYMITLQRYLLLVTLKAIICR